MCGRYIYGLVKTKTDPEGGTTVTYKYDGRGYVSEVTDSLNSTTKYTYNNIGFLIKETTAKGYNTQYYYDKNGFPLKKVLHNGETERFAYNAFGMLTQQVPPNQYNAANDTANFTAENIISNTGAYSGTTQGYRYVYNARNQLTSKTDPMNNATSYTYDVYDNMTSP